MSTTTQIISEEQLKHLLKLYLKDEIERCEKGISLAKETLECDSVKAYEIRILAQRRYEMFTYRKYHLQIQMDNIEWNEMIEKVESGFSTGNLKNK